MYKINNILIQNYGLSPARATGSNIALEGFMDSPKRVGKAFHNWSDEDGVEPYVLEEELRFAETRLALHLHIKGTNRAVILQRLNELYEDIGNFENLIPLVTPWGTYSVYIKETQRMQHLGPGWASLTLVFTRPYFTLPPVTLPTPTETALNHIDNIAFADFGAFITATVDSFNRAATKEANVTAYPLPGYQVTRPGPKEFTTELFFYANTFLALQANVRKFQTVLRSPGVRIVNVDGLERECFNINGTEVSNIMVRDGIASCRLRFSMLLAYDGVPTEPNYLLDQDLEPIIDITGKFIRFQAAEPSLLLDNLGRVIKDRYFEPITL